MELDESERRQTDFVWKVQSVEEVFMIKRDRTACGAPKFRIRTLVSGKAHGYSLEREHNGYYQIDELALSELAAKEDKPTSHYYHERKNAHHSESHILSSLRLCAQVTPGGDKIP